MILGLEVRSLGKCSHNLRKSSQATLDLPAREIRSLTKVENYVLAPLFGTQFQCEDNDERAENMRGETNGEQRRHGTVVCLPLERRLRRDFAL